MKTSILCVLTVVLSPMVVSQPLPQASGTPTRQQQIDATADELKSIISELGVTIDKLTALDKSDAELKKSDQDQNWVNEKIIKGQHEVEFEDMPRLKEKHEQFRNLRQEMIQHGCPMNGGMVDADLADWCNPRADKLMALRDDELVDAQAVAKKKAEYEQLRRDTTARTVANATQENGNNAQRQGLMVHKAQLEDSKKRLEARLLDLKNGVDSCAKVLRQRNVPCEKIKAKCGLMFDGGDPDLPPSIKDSPCDKPAGTRPRTTSSQATTNK